MNEETRTKQISYLLIFIASVIFFAVLKVTSSVVIPVILALMLSFVMLPIVKTLNTKCHFPWIFSVVLVTILVCVFIVVIGTLLGASLRTIMHQYTKYESKFLSIYEFFAERFHLKFNADQTFMENIQNEFSGSFNINIEIKKQILAFSESLLSFTKNMLVVIILFIFLLVEMHLTSEKLNEAFEGRLKGRVMNIVKRTMTQVVRFLFIKFFISLATGVLVYVCIKLVGLDFAVVWGFLAFVLNFIPTFGSFVSVIATTLFALLQFFPHPGAIIFVFTSMVTINMVLGNFVEPRIEGDNLGISPFVILVMLSLWGWMWGFLGMILAVPLTVIIKIVCENVELLRPVAILIGNKPQDTKNEFKASDKEADDSQKSYT